MIAGQRFIRVGEVHVVRSVGVEGVTLPVGARRHDLVDRARGDEPGEDERAVPLEAPSAACGVVGVVERVTLEVEVLGHPSMMARSGGVQTMRWCPAALRHTVTV